MTRWQYDTLPHTYKHKGKVSNVSQHTYYSWHWVTCCIDCSNKREWCRNLSVILISMLTLKRLWNHMLIVSIVHYSTAYWNWSSKQRHRITQILLLWLWHNIISDDLWHLRRRVQAFHLEVTSCTLVKYTQKGDQNNVGETLQAIKFDTWLNRLFLKHDDVLL